MPQDVVMPQLGMTMTEGSVLRWFKQPGERIEKGEPLFEIQTDKVNMEVEATTAGLVSEVLLAPEVVVPVGTVIARITGENEAAEVVPARRLASPRARKLAADKGVDIALVEAKSGRIVEADVVRYLEARAAAAPAVVAAAPAPAPAASIRSVIAGRMMESVQTIPHFYLTVWADATPLEQLRRELIPVVERKAGVRLTFTDLLVKAMALAVAEHPNANAIWTGDRSERREGVHIGVAAQFGEKLLVPVVKDADRLSIVDLAAKRSELVERGRAGKLTPADLEGASLTLSNLGPFGVDQFQAIINPPESAILAVGRIAPRPAVVNGELKVRTTVALTLGVDHRIIDGEAAALFLRSIVRAVEAPYTLVMTI